MFGLNWLKIALYGGSALLVIGVFWTINSWRIDSNNLDVAVAAKEVAEKALQAEQHCLVGTTCAARILQKAQDEAQAVAKAKQEAEDKNIADRRTRDEAAKAESDKNSAQVKQHQSELSNIKLHQNTPSCDEQRKVKIICEVE